MFSCHLMIMKMEGLKLISALKLLHCDAASSVKYLMLEISGKLLRVRLAALELWKVCSC